MDIATLLTGTKWEIIELLAKQPLSPSELAGKLNTTIANISQQLRLLQTAGLVKREKTSTAKPGKPRVLFSIADDYCLITFFSEGFAKKKLVKLTKDQKRTIQNLLK